MSEKTFPPPFPLCTVYITEALRRGSEVSEPICRRVKPQTLERRHFTSSLMSDDIGSKHILHTVNIHPDIIDNGILAYWHNGTGPQWRMPRCIASSMPLPFLLLPSREQLSTSHDQATSSSSFAGTSRHYLAETWLQDGLH